MIDWLRCLGILPIKLFFSFNGEGAFICPMAFVFAVEKTKRNFLPSTAIVSSAFVVSFFAMVTIIAVGSFFVAVPLAFAPVMVSVLLGGGSSLDTFTVLFCFGSSACHGFDGTSHCCTTSARSSPRAFSSLPGLICNILALSRTTLPLSSACAEICILRMVLS